MTNRICSPFRKFLPALLVAATAIAPVESSAAPKSGSANKPTVANATSAGAASFGAPELLAQYAAAQEIFISMMVTLSKQVPSPNNNPRENMYAGLAAIWLGGLTGASFAPAAGTVLGASVGSLKGGVGAMPGAGIGAASGIAVAAGDLVLLGVLTFGAIEYIESKYPHAQYGSLGVPTRTLANLASPSAGAWGPAYFVGQGQAGTYESLVVHIVKSVFNSKIGHIAKNWGSHPSLAKVGFAKKAIERLGYIRSYSRVGPGAKQAAPLTGFMKAASVLLTANSAGVEQAWLSALGIASSTIKVDKGKVEVKLSSALQSVGAPAKISKSFGTLATPKYGGTGGAADPWIRGKFTPGSFVVKVKSPVVVKSGPDKGKLKVVLNVAKGSTLGRGTLEYKWNGTQSTLGGQAIAKLGAAVNAAAFFKLKNGVLVLDRVSVGNVAAAVTLPPLPGPLQAALGTALSTVRSKLDGLAESLLGASAVKQALGGAVNKSHAALTKAVEASAEAKGLAKVTGIGAIAVAGGKLVITAVGKKVALPATASKVAVNQAYAKAKNSAAGAATKRRTAKASKR